jgi:hypothetical protein
VKLGTGRLILKSLVLLLVVSTFFSQKSLGLDDKPSAPSAPKIDSSNFRQESISLEVKDLTPKFLQFYEAAVAAKADPEQRWKLWQQYYGFAAVPPTAQGQVMARKMLDEAWPNYPKVIDQIRAGAAGMKPEPLPILKEVAQFLQLTRPIKIKLVVYVGMMEGNAFSAGVQDGYQIVCIPVEITPEQRELILIHELTHAVHITAAGLSGSWTRSIAVTMLQEGLAIRTAQALRPQHKAETYIEFTPGWLAKCAGKRGEILAGIRPNLSDGSSEAVTRFTVGSGSTGLEREAYYAGWLAVERMVKDGMTLAQIAHLPEGEIVARVDKSIQSLQAESAGSAGGR